MKQILSVFVVLPVALLIGCSFGGPTGSKGDVIWPLSVGSEWQGTTTYFDADGEITDKVPMTFYISGDTLINNETWYFLGAYTDEPQKVGSSYWLLSNQEDGLRQVLLNPLRQQEGELNEQLWMKYPAKPGDGYWSNEYDYIVVKSTDEHTIVPQGSRRCIVYEYVRENGYARHYAAPGVGLVKMEVQIPYDFATTGKVGIESGWTWELEKLVIE